MRNCEILSNQIILKFRRQKSDVEIMKPSWLPFHKTSSKCYDITINHNCAQAHPSNQNAEPRMLIKGAE